MKLDAIHFRHSVTVAAALAALSSSIHPAAAQGYTQTDLVTDSQTNLAADGYAPAAFVDPNLVNPWGIAASASGPFWVSDNNAVLGTAPDTTQATTLYGTTGAPVSLVVGVSNPTGQAFTGGLGLLEPGTTVSPSFIFAGDTGTISAWAGGPTGNGTTAVAAYTGANASYTGIAVGKSASGEDVFAANVAQGRIDVFNSSFAPTTLTGSFTDPNLAAGLSPFNIQNLGGNLYVTYVGAAGGAVAEFDLNGDFLSQLAANGAVGPLDAPWGLALAPVGFGQYGGDLLVGNFGNGQINAFSAASGQFQGTLADANGKPLVNSGLWGLQFGNGGSGGKANTLYFAAGINGEQHGLFGSLAPTAAVPETGTFALLGLGLFPLLAGARRSRRA